MNNDNPDEKNIEEIIALANKNVRDKNQTLIGKHNNIYDVADNIDYVWSLDYYRKYDSIFVDILPYPYLMKDNDIYIDIEHYTSILNQVYRTFYLRMDADGFFQDKFSEYIFINEIKNSKFIKFIDKIKAMAMGMSHVDIYKKIIYNDDINYITVPDVVALFDELVGIGIIYKGFDSGIYKLNFNMTKDEFISFQFGANDECNSQTEKNKYKLDIEYYKKLNSICNIHNRSCFNIIPGEKNININYKKMFWLRDEKLIYIPQYLMFFYSNDGNKGGENG